MAAARGFPKRGAVLIVPLTDAQFEAALEARELDLPTIMIPEGSEPTYLGIMRARHAGMLTHWAEIRAVDRGGGKQHVRVKIGPLERFPRPIEWAEPREVYRPVSVEAEALWRVATLDELFGHGSGAAAQAIVQAASFIELNPPKLDLSLISHRSLLDRAAGFAAKHPDQALSQIDEAVMEVLRDIVAAFYGEAAAEDASRDRWFGEDKWKPTVEAYYELLKEADEKELTRMLQIVEHYLVVRSRANAVESGVRPVQITDLIAVAQAVFDAASGN